MPIFLASGFDAMVTFAAIYMGSSIGTIIPIESATPSIGALATFRKPCGC